MVIDRRTIAQMDGEYALPLTAGPAWRTASEAGLDMSLIGRRAQLDAGAEAGGASAGS
jgi:hypothetical protein